MYDPVIKYGEDGLKFIVSNGSIAFDNTMMVRIEEAFILGTHKWITYLQENGHYDSTATVYVASAWAKEKATPHQVVVEVTTGKTEAEGFGQNELPFFWVDGTTEREYLLKGGGFTYDVNIKCRSTSRSSVAYLVDAIKLGLETDMDGYLGGMDVNIPALSITTTTPTRESIEKLSLWSMDIQIANVFVHWLQILEPNGEILKDYGYYLTRLTNGAL